MRKTRSSTKTSTCDVQDATSPPIKANPTRAKSTRSTRGSVKESSSSNNMNDNDNEQPTQPFQQKPFCLPITAQFTHFSQNLPTIQQFIPPQPHDALPAGLVEEILNKLSPVTAFSLIDALDRCATSTNTTIISRQHSIPSTTEGGRKGSNAMFTESNLSRNNSHFSNKTPQPLTPIDLQFYIFSNITCADHYDRFWYQNRPLLLRLVMERRLTHLDSIRFRMYFITPNGKREPPALVPLRDDQNNRDTEDIDQEVEEGEEGEQGEDNQEDQQELDDEESKESDPNHPKFSHPSPIPLVSFAAGLQSMPRLKSLTIHHIKFKSPRRSMVEDIFPPTFIMPSLESLSFDYGNYLYPEELNHIIESSFFPMLRHLDLTTGLFNEDGCIENLIHWCYYTMPHLNSLIVPIECHEIFYYYLSQSPLLGRFEVLKFDGLSGMSKEDYMSVLTSPFFSSNNYTQEDLLTYAPVPSPDSKNNTGGDEEDETDVEEEDDDEDNGEEEKETEEQTVLMRRRSSRLSSHPSSLPSQPLPIRPPKEKKAPRTKSGIRKAHKQEIKGLPRMVAPPLLFNSHPHSSIKSLHFQNLSHPAMELIIQFLSTSPRCSSLEVLELTKCNLTDEHLSSLAESPFLSSLHTIIFQNNRGVTDEGLKYLSKSSSIDSRSLVHVDLKGTGVTMEGVVQLLLPCSRTNTNTTDTKPATSQKSQVKKNITSTTSKATTTTIQGGTDSNNNNVSKLQYISLAHTNLGQPKKPKARGKKNINDVDNIIPYDDKPDDNFKAFFQSSFVNQLLTLDLSSCRLSLNSLKALSSSTQLGNLTSLRLNDNRFEGLVSYSSVHYGFWGKMNRDKKNKGEKGKENDDNLHSTTHKASEYLSIFLSNPHFSKLRSLELSRCGLEHEDFSLFVCAPYLKNLDRLNLAENELSDDDYEMLLHSDGLKGVSRLIQEIPFWGNALFY